jgi:hypothetical protein
VVKLVTSPPLRGRAACARVGKGSLALGAAKLTLAARTPEGPSTFTVFARWRRYLTNDWRSAAWPEGAQRLRATSAAMAELGCFRTGVCFKPARIACQSSWPTFRYAAGVGC